MKLLKLEFFKCRRRKIALVCAAVLAAELLWFGMYLTRQDAEDLVEGWMMLFYNLALIDAIFLPISVAVIASRNCELEHKGATLKLLETMVTPGRLYCTKMLWGALVLATLLAVRSSAFAAMGAAVHFSGDIPWGKFALFTVISWAVSMMVFALQQGLSLRFVNQAVSLVCGIFGSFIGIMSMLFPDWLVRIVPWGYYGLLSLARMEWDPDTRFTQYFWRWPEPLDVALLLLHLFANVVWGNTQVFLPISLVMIGGWLIDRENTHDTMKNLLTVPVFYPKLLGGKLAVTGLLSLLFGLYSVAVTVLTGTLAGLPGLTPGVILQQGGQVVAAALTTFLVCMPMILIFGQMRGAYLGGSILTFFLGYCILFFKSGFLLSAYPFSAALVLAGFDMQEYNGATEAPSIPLSLLGMGVVIALTAVLLLMSRPSSKGAQVKPKKAKGRGRRQAGRRTR